jgi:hypothetical protein
MRNGFCFTSYLNPASLLTLTPEIVEIVQCLSDRLTKESRFCGRG